MQFKIMVGQRIRQINNLIITLDKEGFYRIYTKDRKLLYKAPNLQSAVTLCTNCYEYLKRDPDEMKDFKKFVDSDNKQEVAKELLKRAIDNLEVYLAYKKTQMNL